jgi:hypothetical protein
MSSPDDEQSILDYERPSAPRFHSSGGIALYALAFVSIGTTFLLLVSPVIDSVAGGIPAQLWGVVFGVAGVANLALVTLVGFKALVLGRSSPLWIRVWSILIMTFGLLFGICFIIFMR